MPNKHFNEQHRPDPENIRCSHHHSWIRQAPNVCPWCLLRRILEMVQKYDQYHLNEIKNKCGQPYDREFVALRDEIENIYFDSGIINRLI